MRKIKLMALLLAALMVMSAFAGCASGVKDDVADLNDRITAIEDKLNGLGDNKDVLDAIESMGKDLNDKIDDLNGRVDAVEKPEEGVTTPAAVKAAAEKALASIEVKADLFLASKDDYTAEDYTKILEAIGAANAAVNAAATEAEVAAAVAALEAALDAYMTYAMKAYDYYAKLLGNLVDPEDEDMKALAEEIAEFIEVVDDVYGRDVAKELAYEIDEKNSINVYEAIQALCDIFGGKAASFEYVDAKGKVKTFAADALKDYVAEAKALVKKINNVIGDEIIYSDAGYGELDKCIEAFNAYEAEAAIIGGDALVALVSNSDKLAEAEEAIKLLADAAEAFDDYAGYDADERKYLGIADVVPNSIDLAETVDGELVLVIDEYKEFAELFAEWVDEYDISDANVEAIFDAKLYAGAYDNYLAAAKLVEYKTAAYDKFVADVVPALASLSKSAKEDAASGIKYGEIYDMIEKTIVVFTAYENMSDADKLIANELGDTVYLSKDEIKDMVVMADVFANAKDAEAAFDAFEAEFDAVADYKDASIYSAYLYTFAEKNAADLIEFFTVTLAEIYADADAINDQIEALVAKVEKNSAVSIKEFMDLSGEYVNLNDLKADGEFKPKFGNKITKNDVTGDWYVLASDVDLDEFEASAVKAGTIAAFNAENKEFVALIKADEFNAAKKALETKIGNLFVDYAAIVKAVAPFKYVEGATYWVDADNDGVYDAGEEVAAPTYVISIDKAQTVADLKKAFNAWVLAGGHEKLENLVEVTYGDNKSYGNVYKFDVINVDNSVIELIYNLESQINGLKGIQTKVLKMVENLLASEKLGAFTVSSSFNSYAATGVADADVYKYYAITKFVATSSTTDNAKNGAYTYANTAYGDGSYTAVLNVTTNDNELASKLSGAKTKAAIIKEAIAAYKAYVANNNEFVVAEKNGAYTVQVKAAADSADVADAIKSLAALEFLYAKGYVIATYATGSDEVSKTLKNTALAAGDFSALENAVNRYNAVSASKITFAGLDLIYELNLADFAA